MGAGAEVGAAIGAPGGPLGVAAGGFLGGMAGLILGSMGTGKVQQAGLNAVGFNDDAQMAADEQENPKSAFIGGLAPAVATMSPSAGASLLERGVAAGGMGAFEAGQEYLQNGKVDPANVGMAAAAGAIAPRPNRAGETLISGGRAAASRVAGRPNQPANPDAVPGQDEAASSQQASVAGDNSLQQPAPTETGDTTGNPQSAPVRSDRQYPKSGSPGDANAPDMLTQGDFSPDVADALSASLDANAVVDHSPAPAIPDNTGGVNADMTYKGEQLPIDTGFPEAAPQANDTEQVSAQPAPEAAPEQAAAPAPEPESAPVIGEFQTAKGSQYQLHPDNSTTRNKAARPEHPGDEGPKPKSERTYFLTKQQAEALAPPQDSRFRLVDHGDGTLSLATPAAGGRNKWGIAPSQRGVPFESMEPKEGLHPLEVWSGSPSKAGGTAYNALHFGNEITQLGQNGKKAPRPVLSEDGLLEVSRAQREAAAKTKTGGLDQEPGPGSLDPDRVAARAPKFDDIKDESLAENTPANPRIHAAIEAERENVHPGPSNAQAEAGNYKKGHPGKLYGRDFSIETAKGGTRRDTHNEPPKWEVPNYPTDYGELLGTKGADGDRMDVHYVGTGDKHFVIDQRDAETGKFDEHKIMAFAKDAADAADHYERGFNDDKGSQRLGSIKEATEAELKAWLAKGAKKKPFDPNFKEAGASEGEKPLPKVVTAAVTKLRDQGLHEAAEKLTAMEPSERIALASKYVNKTDTNLARPDRVRTPAPKVEGTDITGRSKADVARKAADLKAMDDAYAKLSHVGDEIPQTPEAKQKLARELKEFAEATKGIKYKPNVKPASYLFQRAVKKLMVAKNPTEKSWTEFVATAKSLKEGGADEVRASDRTDADIGRSRRTGDDAIANAEARSAGTNSVEDEMIAKLDAKFDIPHEEAEEMVKPEPVTTAADIKKYDTKTAKLDLASADDRAKIQNETSKLAENLVKVADRKAPVGESEGAASKVRKINVNDVDMKAIMERANKAMAKNKNDTAAIREEELGKYSENVPKPDALAAFWNNESGSLNIQKIAQDWRTKAIGPMKFYTKALGGLTNDRQRRVDAALAQVVSTADARLAEKAHALFDARHAMWISEATKPEMMTYLKAIEKPGNKSPADIKQMLLDAGLPAKKVEWMKDEVAFHRDLMDKIWQEDAKHGSQAAYRDNYIPHIFEDAKGADAFIEARIKSLGQTWYQKERMFDLIEQAIKAGFKPKFTNPIELINARWDASIRSNMIVDAARRLNKEGLAFPLGDAPEGVKKAWEFKRQLPDRQQWIFAPDAVELWKNGIEPLGLQENKGVGGSIYRTWMGLKRVMVPVQLMLSAFHELHIIGNIMPAQALHNAFQDVRAGTPFARAYGKALKNIGNDALFALPLDKLPLAGQWLDRNKAFSNYGGRRMQDIWHTPDDQLSGGDLMTKRMFQEAGVSPYQSREDVIGAKRSFAQSIADLKNDGGFKNVSKVALTGIQRGMEKLQEPMFKYQIPALKNMALLRALGTAVKSNPELATNDTLRGQVFRELGKDIDDRFGEMFYKGLFWDKTVKDAGIGSFLSLSWNLGQARQVVGAVNQARRPVMDMLTGNTRSNIEQARNTASNKIGFVSHYVGLSMMTAGALSYALSGQLPTGMDYVFPRSGQMNPDGTPGRLTSPFNTREAVMLKAHADEHNSWLGGAMQLMWNKMVLQPVAELATNKDFFGNKLYDTNAPWYKAALQAVDSTLGRTFNPISIAGADRAKEQGGGKLGQALSYAGFGPGPKYVNETPLERRINHLFSEEGTAYSKPYEYGAKTGLGRGLVQGAIRNLAGDPLESEARQKGRNALGQAGVSGDKEAAMQARKELISEGGLSTRTVSKMRPDNEFQYKFSRLPKETQMALGKEMSDAEFDHFVKTNKNTGLSKMTIKALMDQRSLNR